MRRFALLGFGLILLVVNSAVAEPKCVRILYDSGSQADEAAQSLSSALFLQNLLGHFPTIQKIVMPVEQYQKGQVESCAATIYLGNIFDNNIPQAFLEDFASTQKNVAWLGYNLWKLPSETQRALWGVNYRALSTLDWEHLDRRNVPGYYEFVDYKGETFQKYGELDTKAPHTFNGAYEITLVDLVDPSSQSSVVAWARHSTRDLKSPYILSRNNKWFVADVPFSYLTEDDRYLVFCDLLFDILNEPPRYGDKHPAFFRLEDVHAKVPQWQLNGMLELFHKFDLPFAVSLIPIFVDPYKAVVTKDEDKYIEAGDRPEFVAFIKQVLAQKGTIILHGSTHQYETLRNPLGSSGADFEFWDVTQNRPVPLDSPEWVVNRIEKATSVLAKIGVEPSLWVTPHYAASALDYVLFGQLFMWTAGRINYLATQISQSHPLPRQLTIEKGGEAANGQRLAYLSDLKVDYQKGAVSEGQFFPYEIYGDIYGMQVLPENVGYIQKKDGAPGPGSSVSDLIRRLKRNRVIRDAWGSFFIHPHLLGEEKEGGIASAPGDRSALEHLFTEARALGYDFVDLKTFVKSHGQTNSRQISSLARR